MSNHYRHPSIASAVHPEAGLPSEGRYDVRRNASLLSHEASCATRQSTVCQGRTNGGNYEIGLARADELLGLVSHELRNPLSTILAATRRLSIPGLVAPDEVATLEELARSAARMAVGLEDMMLL